MEENTKPCPHCGKELPLTSAAQCPHCGISLGQETTSSSSLPRTSRLAIVGILLLPLYFSALVAISSVRSPHNVFFELGIPLVAITGFVLSIVAAAKVNSSKGRLKGEGLGALGVIFNILVILVVFSGYRCPARESARRAACANNLRRIGQALELYGTENEGLYPPLDDTKGNFIFEGKSVYPKYLEDVMIFACFSDPDTDPATSFRLISNKHHPGFRVGDVHPDCITDMSYMYLGWVVTSDEEAEAFFKAYDKLSPEDYDKDIIVADGKGNSGGNVIHRLKKGAKSFPNDPSKTAADIPVIWDKPFTDITEFSHIPAGGNILYLDGHLEHIKFGEKFPMSKTMARLLEERPRAPISDCEPLED